MQFLYEFFPVLLFFITFKLYGIYTATVVGIATTFIQVIFTRFYSKKWDKKQLFTLSVFLIFGGLTLYFHNPIFVKWKPTIIFWIFSLIILGSHLFTKKTLAQQMMEPALEGKGNIPVSVWQRLNIGWGVFFFLLGVINLYIAYQFSNEAWVNFKFYGITGALLVFSIAQALCLTRYVTTPK
jgi:intracellular septation protein